MKYYIYFLQMKHPSEIQLTIYMKASLLLVEFQLFHKFKNETYLENKTNFRQ